MCSSWDHGTDGILCGMLLVVLTYALSWEAARGHVHNHNQHESCTALDRRGCSYANARPEAETSEFTWSRCTIARIPWPRNSNDLPLGAEPYIVQSPPWWNQVTAKNLERDKLLQSMANVTCTPSQAGSKRIGNFEMTLAEYLTEWLPKPVSRNAEENRYVFGEFGDQWAPLRDEYVLPPCEVCSRDSAAVTIGLGGMYSGAPWHFHNSAFVEVFHGAKHFSFLPPSDKKAIDEIEKVMQFNASMSQIHWYLEQKPLLEERHLLKNMLECVVHPGEILYFPDNWHHGVVNLGNYTAFVSSFINTDLAKKSRAPERPRHDWPKLLPP
ncbi:unnamed protein product [Durusdinium trenchii]|uniref:Uncharacterized protein n=2 Tax=Durusdinium trenchii TaxID=1381693 RepID=A0ABP0KI20_9DINO